MLVPVLDRPEAFIPALLADLEDVELHFLAVHVLGSRAGVGLRQVELEDVVVINAGDVAVGTLVLSVEVLVFGRDGEDVRHGYHRY